MMENCDVNRKPAELAELVDALDSGSSGSNAFGVQVPGSASSLGRFRQELR